MVMATIIGLPREGPSNLGPFITSLCTQGRGSMAIEEAPPLLYTSDFVMSLSPYGFSASFRGGRAYRSYFKGLFCPRLVIVVLALMWFVPTFYRKLAIGLRACLTLNFMTLTLGGLPHCQGLSFSEVGNQSILLPTNMVFSCITAVQSVVISFLNLSALHGVQ
eukprot:Gb_17052 [translate_table: standard]